MVFNLWNTASVIIPKMFYYYVLLIIKVIYILIEVVFVPGEMTLMRHYETLDKQAHSVFVGMLLICTVKLSL